MINLYIGASGSGKSYEVVVYQIIESLTKGRKVITNLPLIKDHFFTVYPEFKDLLEFRNKPLPILGIFNPTLENSAFNVSKHSNNQEIHDLTARVFSNVWDYYDTWRHQKTGQGALFVVDEAQYCIPKKGTNQEVIEWSALHRHFGQDVIYISQSTKKLNPDILDNVQLMIRLRKQSALGRDHSYIRKVQDGVRGEVMNTTFRDYDKKYFPMYRSHTQGKTVEEATTNDIASIWSHWTFKGALLMLIILIIMGFTMDIRNPMKPKVHKFKTVQKQEKTKVNLQGHENEYDAKNVDQSDKVLSKKDDLEIDPKKQTEKQNIDSEPYSNNQLYILGSISSKDKKLYLIGMAQNGQIINRFSHIELEQSGYELELNSPCSIKAKYKDKERWIICGNPQVSL